MLLQNVKIFTASSEVIECGYILIRKGKILDVGPMAFCPDDDEVCDLNGFTAYPGFVDAHCHIGMWSDGSGMEGDDGNEDTDPSTPQLRAIDAVNPNDFCFDEALTAGITTVMTGPGSANPVAGQMIIIKTFGSTVDEMVVKAPAAMKFALGENPKNSYKLKDQTPATRMATAAIIREQLLKAQRYHKDYLNYKEDESGDSDEPEFDFKSEALADVLDRKIQAHFHCHRADDIFTAIRIIKEFDLDAVLIHCTEGHFQAEKLAEEKIPIVVGPVLGTRTKPELSNQCDDNAVILKNAGNEVAICTDHPEVPIKYLALSAAISVREGMNHDDAIRAITSVPAKILGLSGKVGSIAPGCDADICIFEGDPLSVYEKPKAVFVDGKLVRGTKFIAKRTKK